LPKPDWRLPDHSRNAVHIILNKQDSSRESITLRSLDCDASHLLKAILHGQNHGLQVLRLSHMQYRTPIDKRLELPKNLTHFDCSMSAFTHDSFRSLFVFLGTQLMLIPIVFQARALVIKPTFYNDLAGLDFDSFSKNICEFDWSLNRMPNESVRYLFAFLFTQKKLRLLVMNDVGIENPVPFLKSMIQLINSLPLPGLDISSTDVPPDVLE
jgi:hypothetical protein